MIHKIFIPTLIVLTLFSCNNDQQKSSRPNDTIPTALADNKSSYEIISKRAYEDMVESLYNELVSKDIKLKELETTIDELKKSKGDTIEPFDNFNRKNLSYFNSVDIHVSAIKDSLLRMKMKKLVEVQVAKYNASIKGHEGLLSLISSKELTMDDLHQVLKIVKTLPMIDKYQTNSLPSKKPLEKYIEKQKQTIRLADSLSKN